MSGAGGRVSAGGARGPGGIEADHPSGPNPKKTFMEAGKDPNPEKIEDEGDDSKLSEKRPDGTTWSDSGRPPARP